ALVDLHVELRGVEDHRETPRRALRRAQQRDGLLADRLGPSLEVEPPDVLEPGRLERSTVAVRVAPTLVLVALDRVCLAARADMGDRLLGEAAVGRGERLPLAAGVVAGLGERHAPGPGGGRRGRGEGLEILSERNLD